VNTFIHDISIVIPVYKGELVLKSVVEEIFNMYGQEREEFTTKQGHIGRIVEVVLIHDCGPDNSHLVMKDLEKKFSVVRNVWLSRNFGQHAATLAGFASSQGSWIVTMDEDGQQDPKYILDFLDKAIETGSQIVYAKPVNLAPHGWFRNKASKLTKRISKSILANANFEQFNSYRLVLGESGRALAAYAGQGVYLDVALTWVANRSTSVPVNLRSEDRPSGYSFRTLLSHFGRLIVTAGARPLRLISAIGFTVAITGLILTGYVISMKLFQGVNASGWTSVVVAVLVTSGLTMFSLGVIAEFLGASVRLNMGMPLYLSVSDPTNGPLGQANKSDPNEDSETKPGR